MDTVTAMRALAALVLVLGLIGGLYWGLRRFSNLTPNSASTEDLKVTAWRPFDGRKRFAVVRWGDQEFLILTGQAQDTVIASRQAKDDAPAESGQEV